MSAPRKIVLKDGTVKWRIRVEGPRDPVTGERVQVNGTFDRQKDAKDEIARIQHQRAAGTYVPPSSMTLNEMLDSALKSAIFEKEAATKSNYGHALRPARERLGHRKVQSITREDIEDLRDWMLASGRKRGGKPGTGLGARSVRLTISRLSAAFEQAVDDGKVTRNPCRRVRLPKLVSKPKGTWSVDEAQAFLRLAMGERYYLGYLLVLYGLRREELCGIRWQDWDAKAGTLTIAVVRVVVDGKVIVKDAPKSLRSSRTLPLDATMTGALTAERKRQAAERLAAGEAYAASGYVLVDELGEAVNPEWFSDEFERVAERAGVPRMTPHGGRHTANSLMASAGVPEHIRAAWCGHTVEVNKTTYTHVRPEDLVLARDTLAGIYKIAEG